ncbi:sigma-70 family RNA polymerase sigma factor [Candidatus Poribacteria bacterium]|nr:sigma-70 family RNA polymerase sigma factor [Candidatus Poribacteria bacterium]
MRSDDEKLVSQTLAGDRDAFGVLVHKYQEMVYAYAFQKVRNEEDAQDVTQEIFWRAYHGLYQLRQPHRFRSWLYTIMSNECKRRLASIIKTRQRETALDDATGDALRIEPAHTAPTAGWQVDLEQALSELPDDNRVAVPMFYMGDNSLKEISEFLGISVNTVKGKLYRARQQLGSALSDRYGRLLKSYKLKGGFLMQFMEQIHHIPSPTMVSSWSSTAIGKILFSLIMAVCVLIGIARHGTDSPTSLPMDRIGMEETTGVILLAPIADATRSSIPVVPAQEKLPRAGSSRASEDQGRQLAARRATPGSAGEAQRSAVVAEDGTEKLIFSGRVVDNDGVPVADAEVLYSVGPNSSESATRTEVDGRFRFEFLRPELKKWDRVSIVAAHPEHAIGWQSLQPQSAANYYPQVEAGKLSVGIGICLIGKSQYDTFNGIGKRLY